VAGGLILPPGLRVSGGGAREADPLDPLNRGLLGRWTFEDGTGRDSSAWGSHAAAVNGASQGVGRYGKAALLAGPAGTATQNYNAGARQQFAGLQVPLTITARVFQASGSGYQPILAQYRNFPADLIFMLRVDLGDLRYYCRTSGSIQGFGSSFSVPPGQWVFVAAVISGTIAAPSATIYVNRASQSGALSSMASSVDLTVNTRIGSNDHTMIGAGDEGFNGRIEDIGLWGRALTTPELDRVRDQPFAGTTNLAQRLFYAARPQASGPLSAEIAGTVDITASAAAALALDATIAGTVDITASIAATTTLEAEIAGTVPITASISAQLDRLAEIAGTIPITASITAFMEGGATDTHDGYLRRSRKQRALEAVERRREAERLADAQALQLELEAALGMAADVDEEAPQPAVEAVQEAVAVVRALPPIAPAVDFTAARAAIADLLATIDAAARAKALADDDEDVEMLLRAL